VFSESQESFGPLSVKRVTKLKQLSIISFASESKTLSYTDLLTELEIEDEEALEEMITSCIYEGLLEAKLNQRNRRVDVVVSA
jgi:COP9 signalosome complex subunit 7